MPDIKILQMRKMILQSMLLLLFFLIKAIKNMLQKPFIFQVVSS